MPCCGGFSFKKNIKVYLTGEKYALLKQEKQVGKYKYYYTTFVVMGLWLFLILSAPIAYQCEAQGEENPYQAEVVITQEAINKAQREANVPYEVEFTPKIEKEVSIMEKRHFKNKITNESDAYRINRLEDELMGKTWEYTPLETRMRRLKLASQRTLLAGTSLPSGMSRKFSPKKIHNDSIELRERDEVGIIDGLLKVYAPDLYEKFRFTKDRQFERYSE